MLFRVKFPLYAVLLFGLCPCAVPVCSCCSACVWTVSRHCLTSFKTVCSQSFHPPLCSVCFVAIVARCVCSYCVHVCCFLCLCLILIARADYIILVDPSTVKDTLAVIETPCARIKLFAQLFSSLFHSQHLTNPHKSIIDHLKLFSVIAAINLTSKFNFIAHSLNN